MSVGRGALDRSGRAGRVGRGRLRRPGRSSVGGAGLSGSTYYTKGAITAHWTTTTPGSLISRFELLVDGKVAATASGTAASVGAALPLGGHTVAVRAVHQSGRTATTAALSVVAETTAPTFTTTPKLSLRTGTVNTTAVPVTLGWRATDDKALKSVQLLSPTTATFGPTTTSSSRTAKSGAASTWSMKASDHAGNTRTSSPSFTPVILQETSAAKSGTWTKTWSGSAKHTVRIVVVGTSGRPAITTDGLVYLK